MFEAVTRRSALLMLGAGVAAPLLAAPRVTLAEVVRRNTRARGGAAALDRMHSLAVDVEIVEKGQPIVGRYAANTSGDVRIDIYADGKNVYSEGVDRSGVWRWTGDGPAEPSKAVGAANALINGAENHLFGWHRFPQRGHRMALMPPETIDATPFQVVEVRYTTGQTSYFYVDPHSWQAVRRRDERAYHPDNDPTKQKVESRFYDFQRVAGVVASHRSTDVDLGTGQVLSTNRTLSRRVDPVLAADYFDRDRRAPGAWSAA